MIPRRLRLSRQGFAARGQKRAASRHFSLSYALGVADGGVAVVISKKAERSAVKRHLLKRRAASVLREYADPSRALVVYARPGASALPYQELTDELNSLMRSILPTS